jgi:hypothetical protein
MHKENVIYTYIHICTHHVVLFSHNNKIMSFAENQLKIIMLNEISQAQKAKYSIYGFAYMWNLDLKWWWFWLDCKRETEKGISGREEWERRGYKRVKRIKVHYIYMYININMKIVWWSPQSTVWKGEVKGTGGELLQSTLYMHLRNYHNEIPSYY